MSVTIKASYFSANNVNSTEFGEQSLIIIDNSGQITHIIDQNQPNYQKELAAAQANHQLIQLAPGHYLLPCFIDLHNHAPQWPQAGTTLDRLLSEWLEHYTFPLEARFKDLDYAQLVYQDLVHEMLANGTTTALYFGSLHNAANLKLAEICHQLGQRALIGTVAMDNPDQTPTYYRDSSSQVTIDKTRIFIDQIQQTYRDGAIQPVITPRFIPSCQTDTLKRLGKLATDLKLRVQTHCSESDWEHQYVLDRFGQTDAAVLKSFGLLNQHSVLAHATQLTANDQAIIKSEQAAIAHCPISNAYFGNGVLPTRELLHQKIKIGLGSDIASGYTPSLYANLQAAVTASQIRQDGVNPQLSPENGGVHASRITVEQAFYLATAGGAKSLGLQTGQIKAGFAADLQIVKAPLNLTPLTPEDRLAQLLFRHTQNQIKAVYVQGKLIHQKEQAWYDNTK